MNRIQSKDHRIGTYEINKISLSGFNAKMCILNNGYDDGLISSWLSEIKKKTFILITIQNSFLFQAIKIF